MAKAKYRIKAGSHMHEGKLYRFPDILELDEDPRIKWRNKFELVSDPAPAANAEGGSPTPAPLTTPEDDKDAARDDKDTNPADDTDATTTGTGDDNTGTAANGDDDARGKEYTDRFPDAVENSLQVYKAGRLYSVYDSDDETAVLNADDELSNQDEVKDWLASYLA